MANPFVHVELHTDDPSKAKKFYQSLFEWKLEDSPGMDYTMIGVGEGTGGGIMKNPVPGRPSHWLAYVFVEDVTALTNRATSLGAKIINDITEIPGYGSFSIIADPTGASIGLWQPKEMK